MSRIQIDMDEVKYQFMCQMAERIIESGGLIFGGFLRDKLIRDADRESSLPQNLNAIFIGDLENLGTFYEEIMKDDVNLESNADNRSHPFLAQGFRYSCDLIMKNSKQIVGEPIKVRLDLLVSSNPIEPFYSEHDLDCNVLICDRAGIRSSFDPKAEGSIFNKFTRQQEIVKRILNRKTSVLPVDVGKPSAHLQNALKMMLRGWTITNVSSFQVVDESESDLIDSCLFCRGEIQVKAVHLNCCMKYAHPDCFSRFLGNPSQCFFSKTGCRHNPCFDLTDQVPRSFR